MVDLVLRSQRTPSWQLTGEWQLGVAERAFEPVPAGKAGPGEGGGNPGSPKGTKEAGLVCSTKCSFLEILLFIPEN